MKRIIVAAATIGALALTSIHTFATEGEIVCADVPEEQWASPEAATSQLSKVIDKEFVLGIDKGCYEAEVEINDMTEIDVYLDPVTLEVIKIRTEGSGDS